MYKDNKNATNIRIYMNGCTQFDVLIRYFISLFNLHTYNQTISQYGIQSFPKYTYRQSHNHVLVANKYLIHAFVFV